MASEKDQVFSNYIPISRKLFEHEFWTEERVFSRAEAWVDIVRSASWEDDNKRIINGKWVRWKRGQWPVSLRFLGDRWKWSRSKASKFLDDLKRENMVEIVTDNVTAQTLITVCKYDEYNPSSKKKGHQKRQRSDSEVTAKGQQSDKVNNSNNSNNDEKGVSAPVKKSLFEKFQEFINEQAPRLNLLEYPITEQEFERLMVDFPGEQGKAMIKDVLISMQNSKILLKKYTSANLTLRSWIRIRKEKGFENSKPQQQTLIGELSPMELEGRRILEQNS